MLSQELRKTHPSQPKRDFRKSQPMRPDFSLRAEVQGSGLQPLGLDGCLHTTRFHFETAGTQPEPDPLATKPPAVEVGSTRGHFSAVRVQLQTELHCATVPCSGTEQASLFPTAAACTRHSCDPRDTASVLWQGTANTQRAG